VSPQQGPPRALPSAYAKPRIHPAATVTTLPQLQALVATHLGQYNNTVLYSTVRHTYCTVCGIPCDALLQVWRAIHFGADAPRGRVVAIDRSGRGDGLRPRGQRTLTPTSTYAVGDELGHRGRGP